MPNLPSNSIPFQRSPKQFQAGVPVQREKQLPALLVCRAVGECVLDWMDTHCPEVPFCSPQWEESVLLTQGWNQSDGECSCHGALLITLPGWQQVHVWCNRPACELWHYGRRLLPGPGKWKRVPAASSHAGATLCGHPCHWFEGDPCPAGHGAEQTLGFSGFCSFVGHLHRSNFKRPAWHPYFKVDSGEMSTVHISKQNHLLWQLWLHHLEDWTQTAPYFSERLRDIFQTRRLPSLERRGTHRTCWNSAACCFPPALGSKSLQIGFPVGAFLGTAVSWHGHQLQNVWYDAHDGQACKSWLIHPDQCCLHRWRPQNFIKI